MICLITVSSDDSLFFKDNELIVAVGLSANRLLKASSGVVIDVELFFLFRQS